VHLLIAIELIDQADLSEILMYNCIGHCIYTLFNPSTVNKFHSKTRTALSRTHTSAKAADVAKFLYC